MKIGIGIGITGRVVAERIKPDGTVAERLDFPNVILNIGWDVVEERFNSQILYPGWLYLGTGTTEPSADDLGLENIGVLGGKALTNTIWPASGQGFLSADAKTAWTEVSLRFDYTQGQATGTWTELGLAFDDTYIRPFNRALFRDANGDPISVTVLPDEYFRVTVTLRKYIRLQDGVITWEYNGVQHSADFKLQSSGIINSHNSYSWWRKWPTLATFIGQPWQQLSNGAGVTRSVDLAALKANFTYFSDYIGANMSFTALTFVNYAYSVPLIRGDISPAMVKNDGWLMDGTFSIQFFRDCVEMEEGTATSGTTTTLTDTTKTWTVDQFKNKRLLITGGTGEGQTIRILSNTADTLTFAALGAALDNTSTYRICSNG